MYTPAMPSETMYLRDKHLAFLDALVADAPGVENRSQAVQYCINATKQAKAVEEDQ